MTKADILNDKTLWNRLTEDSINEFMEFKNKGKQICFLQYYPYKEWFIGYCINNYLYYDESRTLLIPIDIIEGWQWIEYLPIFQ